MEERKAMYGQIIEANGHQAITVNCSDSQAIKEFLSLYFGIEKAIVEISGDDWKTVGKCAGITGTIKTRLVIDGYR